MFRDHPTLAYLQYLRSDTPYSVLPVLTDVPGSISTTTTTEHGVPQHIQSYYSPPGGSYHKVFRTPYGIIT